jgi:hypothetical protein
LSEKEGEGLPGAVLLSLTVQTSLADVVHAVLCPRALGVVLTGEGARINAVGRVAICKSGFNFEVLDSTGSVSQQATFDF